MRTKAFLSAGVALIALLVSLAPLAAAHDVEIAASGDFVFTSVVVISTVVEEDEVIITQTFTQDFTGTFIGSAVGEVTIVMDLETGEFEFQGMSTFTGTVAGLSGTTVISFEGEGLGDSFQGEFEIVSGTGELANLEGDGTVEATLGVGTYSGQLEFDELAASGTFIPTGEGMATLEEEDNRCFIEVSGAAFDLTGTLVGSATVDVTVVQEAPCDVEFAPSTFEGDGTFVGTVFVGTVAIASGTFDFEIEGAVDALGNFEFELEIEEGTGGLADLDGELTFEGTFPFSVTYSGQLEFDD